jgi:ribosomal protein L37E
MEKPIKCPRCGRMNTEGNLICSNCGLVFSTKKEFPFSKEKIKEDVEKLLPASAKQKFSLEFLKPNETKLFLFISLVFTSLFLQMLVKNKIIFSIFFYPSLYAFTCYWVSKPKINWKTFLVEFFSLLVIFFIIFSLI